MLTGYVTAYLPEIIAELRLENVQHHIILPHDNASFRTAIQSINYVKKTIIDLMIHFSHSSDLASKDFFLLLFIKNKSVLYDLAAQMKQLKLINLVSKIQISKRNICLKNQFIRMKKNAFMLKADILKNSKAVYLNSFMNSFLKS